MAEASVLPYGAAGSPDGVVEVVSTFGDLELEYAALRKHCVMLDLPQRGVIEVTGRDRLDFLNRMVTQELKGLPPFRAKRSFWLNGKGRVEADLRIVDFPSRTLLEMDVMVVRRVMETLGAFIVTEDVVLTDRTESMHRLSLHGPTGLWLLGAIASSAAGADASGPAFDELMPDRACVIRIGPAEVVVFREDSAGEVGLELVVAAEQALFVYQQLLDLGHDRDHGESSTPGGTLASRVRLRPAGWHAWNIARIEAGSPLFLLDFGPQSLPAETGVLNDRVSFTKGCYLGQEIVARMHARGHPKQLLCAVKFEIKNPEGSTLPVQPISGAALTLDGGDGAAIGAVSSSTLAPMVGSAPIALAAIKHAHAKPGTVVVAPAEGLHIKGVLQPTLVSYARAPRVTA